LVGGSNPSAATIDKGDISPLSMVLGGLVNDHPGSQFSYTNRA